MAINKMRGAIPTPRHRLLAATPQRAHAVQPQPTAWIPKQLSIWGNSTYGDCVSAEEAFCKATAKPEIFLSDEIVVEWARKHGFLNGAGLTEVMDQMQTDGFVIPSAIELTAEVAAPRKHRGKSHADEVPVVAKNTGSVLTDGPYRGVDYSNEDVLQSAISEGPVKIAIDADALPQTAGEQQGWYALGNGKTYTNTDHCVSICGFGPMTWLYQQLGVPCPDINAVDKRGYLLFTWATIGFADYDWLMSTCAEAWVRHPSNLKDGAIVS